MLCCKCASWCVFHELCKNAVVINIKSDIPELHMELRARLLELEFKEI